MIALIAGSGQLPAHLAAALVDRPYVAALEGFKPEGLEPDMLFRIETIGSLIQDLAGQGIKQVCFAGGIQRPGFDPVRLDDATRPLVPRLMGALGAGDDGALRVVMALFEEAGMAVVGAHDIAPTLLPPAGTHSAREPDRDAAADVVRSVETVEALGARDIGQSCVVRRGQVLAVEAMPGTDWMLESLTRFDATDGLFYKASKPGQDRRIDLPTIGPETIRNVASAGLRGVVLEAGGVMVLDLDACRREADLAGLFLWVRMP